MILKIGKIKLTDSNTSRLFSVITRFIPVILVQQVTRLVNKFALLLHKYRFNQDCRNASGNDGKRRGFSICCKFFNASTINVMLACEHSELPRASRNIMAILLNAANSISSRFLIVITGFIPVILVQQMTNIVNTLALLFKRSLLSQDCRNASGNDDKRRWLNICCKFFKYPSPDTNVSTSPAGGEVLKQVLLPQCAPDATGFLSDVYKRGTRARKFLADGVQGGRSMIEMLGVLAIIAVLSVGGIAGYSKAMEKYKLNKVTEQYSYLFQGLIEHGDSLRLSGPEDKFLTNIVTALNLVPTSWTLNSNNLSFIDDYGNNVDIITRNKEFVFNLGFRNAKLNTKTCEAFFQNVFQPLHAYMTRIHFYDMKGVNQQYMYYGDTMCSNGRLCLRDMTVSDIHKACGYCSIKEGSGCFVVIYF